MSDSFGFHVTVICVLDSFECCGDLISGLLWILNFQNEVGLLNDPDFKWDLEA